MLFTFPSRYWFTIGLRRVFSLGGWARRIHTGFHVPRATQGTARGEGGFAYGPVTRSGAPFQTLPLASRPADVAALQPRTRLDADGLGCSPVARRYWGYHFCFLLLRVLRYIGRAHV